MYKNSKFLKAINSLKIRWIFFKKFFRVLGMRIMQNIKVLLLGIEIYKYLPYILID